MFSASRVRYFGGTSNHWGRVWCDMPTSLDFEMREDVPYSGWPFPLSDLETWYPRAEPVLKLGPYGYALSDWGLAPSDIPEPFRGPHFVCRVLQQGAATRFVREYGPESCRARNVSVYLHANALRFDAGEESRSRATSLCRCPPRWSLYSSGPHIRTCGRRNRKCAPPFAVRQRDWHWPGKQSRSRRSVLHAPFGILVRRHCPRRPYAELMFQTGEGGARYIRLGLARRFMSYISLSNETKRQLKLPNLRVRFQYPKSPRSMR
jgi:choline dehydrogenase-like flavoprotein